MSLLSSDFDFATFLATCDAWRVALDRFEPSKVTAAVRKYDSDTDRWLAAMSEVSTARMVRERPPKQVYTFTPEQLAIAVAVQERLKGIAA